MVAEIVTRINIGQSPAAILKYVHLTEIPKTVSAHFYFHIYTDFSNSILTRTQQQSQKQRKYSKKIHKKNLY